MNIFDMLAHMNVCLESDYYEVGLNINSDEQNCFQPHGSNVQLKDKGQDISNIATKFNVTKYILPQIIKYWT